MARIKNKVLLDRGWERREKETKQREGSFVPENKELPLERKKTDMTH